MNPFETNVLLLKSLALGDVNVFAKLCFVFERVEALERKG